MKVVAIVVAGGSGTRMKLDGNERSKLYINLLGKQILSYPLVTLEKSHRINEIILVIKEKDKKYCKKEIIEKFGFKKIKKICFAGNVRQDSVYNGLKSITDNPDIVFIHDGARLFLTQDIINKSIDAARIYKAAVVAVPSIDTIKYSTKGKFITSTLNRNKIWLVQTPQVFEYALILKAYEKAYQDGFYGTDDSSLVEQLGKKVKIIMGSYENIKITTRLDLLLAEVICKKLKLRVLNS